jgi:broad specificity phosphatase PhoE
MANVIHTVRHAAPPWENQKRYWGKADPGVVAESLAQAEQTADEMIPKPARILTSPLARAKITAKRIAVKLGITPEIIPELAEVDFGLFDGLTFPEAERLHPKATQAWAEQGDAFTFPGGESIPAFLARAKQAFTICTELPEDTILCVTHGGILSAWHCFFHNIPLESRFSFIPEYATLTTFAGKH